MYSSFQTQGLLHQSAVSSRGAVVSYRAVGDIDPWTVMAAHFWSADDIYVFRASITGVTLRDRADALVFASSFGQGQNEHLSVLGLALTLGTTIQLDIVSKISGSALAVPLVLSLDGADDMAKAIMLDPDVRAVFPQIQVTSPSFGRLTAPQAAIDHWQSLPVLWDGAKPGVRGGGVPTSSFATPPEYSIVIGKADDGARAVPWASGPPPKLQPPPPPAESNAVYWLAGAVVFAGGVALAKRRIRA